VDDDDNDDDDGCEPGEWKRRGQATGTDAAEAEAERMAAAGRCRLRALSPPANLVLRRMACMVDEEWE